MPNQQRKVNRMTYEEAYMQCESIEELEKMVNTDIEIARFLNADRIPIIEKSAIKVANLKFKAGEEERTLKHFQLVLFSDAFV